MDRTVCELFAGVGGFRCGLNHILTTDDYKKNQIWDTVWFNQYEPSEKSQYAHGCYRYHFGISLDKDGNDTTNCDIETVDYGKIHDFNLLVGGFPCQNYSIATTCNHANGIEGKSGVLWWSIQKILDIKQPPFVLLENVDRLLKSPAKQKGRDFAIILTCFRDAGYSVEWRVIDASEYGYQQRRKRIFIFAYKNSTVYYNNHKIDGNISSIATILCKTGFFAKTFKVQPIFYNEIKFIDLQDDIKSILDNFKFTFKDSGIMQNNKIFTSDILPDYNGKTITLYDILDDNVSENYFISDNELYYTNPYVTCSDETIGGGISKHDKHTWQYIKGAKKIWRRSSTGFEYIYTEGAMSMIDEWNKPARTLLTSEGSFNRSTHIVKDKQTGKVRLLTAEETEKIQGFPVGHTRYAIVNDNVVEIPERRRKFLMGNALVVNLIKDMEAELSEIFDDEY